MVQFINITASLVIVATIIFVIQIIFKWFNAPRFIIGIVPRKDEMKNKNIPEIGKASLFDEYYFDKKFLAKYVKREREATFIKKDDVSSRDVFKDNKDIVELPIVIQNVGRSEAAKYKLVISFDKSDIRIVDIITETLKVDGLYIHDKSIFRRKSLLNKLPHEEIKNINEELGLVRDYLSFIGSLASFSFEWIILKLKVPQDCNSFSIIFRIDCADFFFTTRRIYVQCVNVIRT